MFGWFSQTLFLSALLSRVFFLFSSTQPSCSKRTQERFPKAGVQPLTTPESPMPAARPSRAQDVDVPHLLTSHFPLESTLRGSLAIAIPTSDCLAPRLAVAHPKAS